MELMACLAHAEAVIDFGDDEVWSCSRLTPNAVARRESRPELFMIPCVEIRNQSIFNYKGFRIFQHLYPSLEGRKGTYRADIVYTDLRCSSYWPFRCAFNRPRTLYTQQLRDKCEIHIFRLTHPQRDMYTCTGGSAIQSVPVTVGKRALDNTFFRVVLKETTFLFLLPFFPSYSW